MPTTNATLAGLPHEPLALLPKIPALDNTFGAVLIGTFIGLILYGITLHQSYRYVRLYPHDSRVLKCLVAFVVLLETVTSVFCMHVCYYYLTSNYFNPEALLFGIWSINLFPMVSSFFARRVWHLGGRLAKAVVISACMLCLLEMGFLIAASSEAYIIPTFAGYRRVTWLVSTGSTMAVTADMLLTVALIVFLNRSRTGLKRTDTMIDILIMYSVNTGLLTGILNLLSLIFAFTRPGDLIYIGFGIVAVKMYTTTLLAALNSRQSLAAHGSGLSNDTNPFGLSGTSTVHTRNLGARVHAPQLRSSRTDETSVIELKAPSHFVGAGSGDEVEFPSSDSASPQYRRKANEMA